MPLSTEQRIGKLKKEVQNAQPSVCIERAISYTRYFKKRANRKKNVHIQMAEALDSFLQQKSIEIFPGELLIGNFSSKRVGGSIYPELHGLPVMEDLFKFDSRPVNPLQISTPEKLKLLGIVPFWKSRFLGYLAYQSHAEKLKFISHQLKNQFYFLNEVGGIAHLAPDYKKLITVGTGGIYQEAEDLQKRYSKDSDSWSFLESVKISAKAMEKFSLRYADLAKKMASNETNRRRRAELESLAKICSRVPSCPATSLHEALQSILLVQIAINLESLDNSICPGRIDQYLLPFFIEDISKGTMNKDFARELFGCFSIKLSELIPVFSSRISRVHGGMFNGQVVTVGGVDQKGNDSTNELSEIILDVVTSLKMRQPNFHARLHPGSPRPFCDKVYEILASGNNSPALYNDQVIIEAMTKHGYTIEDARNYTAVGCVEPVSQGKSFSSTDAALVNVPILLEMALNEGKRFGDKARSGIRTRPVSKMKSMKDVRKAFEQQMEFQIEILVKDLHKVEIANYMHHPTPLTSMLLDGCLKNGKCSTLGGAKYNFSGVQCVGPVDTGDALYAIEKSVFLDKKISLVDLVDILKANFQEQSFRQYLLSLPKFGNDNPDVDHYAIYVTSVFRKALSSYKTKRNGNYVMGLYSVTVHQHFGKCTGAMAHGRKSTEPFSSGLSPVNGMDKLGPTALLNSMNRFDFTKVANGINFNIKFDCQILKGNTGTRALETLIKTWFQRGGMQAQINVMDPIVLIARTLHLVHLL